MSVVMCAQSRAVIGQRIAPAIRAMRPFVATTDRAVVIGKRTTSARWPSQRLAGNAEDLMSMNEAVVSLSEVPAKLREIAKSLLDDGVVDITYEVEEIADVIERAARGSAIERNERSAWKLVNQLKSETAEQRARIAELERRRSVADISEEIALLAVVAKDFDTELQSDDTCVAAGAHDALRWSLGLAEESISDSMREHHPEIDAARQSANPVPDSGEEKKG